MRLRKLLNFMTRHDVAFDLSLSIIYLMKYSVLDCEIPKTFHT